VCVALRCIVSYCIVLYCIVLYCIVFDARVAAEAEERGGVDRGLASYDV